MPYVIKKSGSEYCVYNKDTGDNKGCSDTRAMAVKHMRALYAAAAGETMGKKDYHPDIYYINSYIRGLNQIIEDAQYNLTYDSEHPELQDMSEQIITEATEHLDNLIAWRMEWFGTEEDVKSVNEDSIVTRVIDGVKSLINATLLPPVPGEGPVITLTKEANNRTRVMMRVSNNFKDRHGEIITEEAHRQYVSYLDSHKEEMPEFWVWHIPGSRWGQADTVDYSDGFLTASGLVDVGLEHVAERLARKDFGVSHGFRSIKLGKDEIAWYKSFEFSPLPRESAANTFTSIIAMEVSMDPTKRQKLLDIGLTEELLNKWDSDSKGVSERLKAMGIEWKDVDDGDGSVSNNNSGSGSSTSIDKNDPSLGDVLTAVQALGERIGNVETKQKELEQETSDVKKKSEDWVASVLEAAIAPGMSNKGHVASESKENAPNGEVTKSQSEWEEELANNLLGVK